MLAGDDRARPLARPRHDLNDLQRQHKTYTPQRHHQRIQVNPKTNHRLRRGWVWQTVYGVPCTWDEMMFPPFRINQPAAKDSAT